MMTDPITALASVCARRGYHWSNAVREHDNSCTNVSVVRDAHGRVVASAGGGLGALDKVARMCLHQIKRVSS